MRPPTGGAFFREGTGINSIYVKKSRRAVYGGPGASFEKYRRQGRFREIVLAIASSARKEGITRLWIGTIGDLGVRTLPEIGFTPVLCFAVQNLPWIRYLRVWPAEEADARLVEAARSALRADGRPLLGGSVLGRHGRRRH